MSSKPSLYPDIPISRYSDYGPLDIEDSRVYLKLSKAFFYRKWKETIKCDQKITDYEFIRLLGSGSFGDVALAQHLRDKKMYAVKIIQKEKIIKHKQIQHTLDEKCVLHGLRCPFTIYLVYFFMNNTNLYIVLPYIEGGELFGHLVKVGRFDEAQSRLYLAQIVLAMEYLHFLDLIYRDLKPENILLDHTGYLKLADFGFCKRLNKDRTYTLCGTPEYLAPEVILSRGYGQAVDWWAIGILAFELVSGNPPFVAKEPMKIYEKIISGRYKMPAYFSSDLKDLIKNLVQTDLTKRFGNLKDGVEDIKRHRWFRSVNWLAMLNRKVPSRFIPTHSITPASSKTKIPHIKIDKEDKYREYFANF